MIKNFKVITLVILSFVTINASAMAPVVDDSENYALLEQQASSPSPVAHESYEHESFDETESPLAKDNSNNNDNYNNSSNDNLDSSNQIKELRQDIQELRGQLEVQAHEITALKEQQLTFYKDLDSRITNKGPINSAANNQMLDADKDPKTGYSLQATDEAAKPDGFINQKSAGMSHVSANTNPADEQISYLAAYELVKKKQFTEALPAMQTFLAKYPNGFYSANAEYWTGELYLENKNYKSAISHFNTVIKQFPSSNKYSASLLKMSYALANTGQINEAKGHLQEILKKYPDTNTSELAQIKLNELNRSL